MRFAAGFSTLATYLLVSRAARAVVGGTSDATTALWLAFLTGTAVAAAWRRRPSDRSVAIGVGIIALYGLGFTVAAPLFTKLYLTFAPAIGESTTLARNAARFGFGVSVFGLPSLCAGVLLPPSRVAAVATYCAGLTGAALVASSTGWLQLGLTGAVVLAVWAFVRTPAPTTPYRELLPLPRVPWPLVGQLTAVLAIAAVGFGLFSRGLDLIGVLIGFFLQHSTSVAVVLLAGLGGAAVARKGWLDEASMNGPAGFACGFAAASLVATSASHAGGAVGVLVGATAGAIAASRASWPGYSLALAGVAAALAGGTALAGAMIGVALGLTYRSEPAAIIIIGAGFGVLAPEPRLAAALLLVTAGLVLVRSHRPVGVLSFASLIGILLLPAPDDARPPPAAIDHSVGVDYAALLTSGRARALAFDTTGAAALTQIGFDDVTCASVDRAGESCLEEDPHSLLLEQETAYDVILARTTSGAFYALAAPRLRPNGVIVSESAAGSSSLAHASTWKREGRSFTVASNDPLEVDVASVRDGGARLETLSDLERAEPLPFRGTPTRSEEVLARAAFLRGRNDARALEAVASMWREDASLSAIASRWLYELDGSGIEPISDITSADNACVPLTRFIARVDNLRMTVVEPASTSLDGTEPSDALDGIFDPELGSGWRSKPERRAATLELALPAPMPLHSVSIVARSEAGALVARIYGRDETGWWHPLGSASTDCRAIRRFQWGEAAGRWTGLLIEVIAARDAPIAIHEVWAS